MNGSEKGDLKREISALLRERGAMTEDDIARELQTGVDSVIPALNAMQDIEGLHGFAQVSKWRLRPPTPQGETGPRWLGGDHGPSICSDY